MFTIGCLYPLPSYSEEQVSLPHQPQYLPGVDDLSIFLSENLFNILRELFGQKVSRYLASNILNIVICTYHFGT